MKTIEYWQVEEGYDRTTTLIGCFTSESIADEVAGGKNNAYRSVYKKTLTLFDTVEDFENNTREKIRERALAKLTVEERIALGFK
jgi:hypothetical protein